MQINKQITTPIYPFAFHTDRARVKVSYWCVFPPNACIKIRNNPKYIVTSIVRAQRERRRERESSVAHKRNTMLDISFFDLWFAGSQCESHWMWNQFAHTSLLSIRHSWNCTKGIGFMFIWSVKFIYLLFCLVEVATINKTNRNELNSATIHNECCRSRK